MLHLFTTIPSIQCEFWICSDFFWPFEHRIYREGHMHQSSQT